MSSLTTAGSSMEEEDRFDTRLSLEIGDTSRAAPPVPQTARKKATAVRLFGEMISPQDHGHDHHAEPRTPAVVVRKKRAPEGDVADIASSGSIIRHSKKARTTTSQAQQEDGGDRWSPSDGGGGSRKKLRLTTAQATMLEDSFRAHNILSHAQKHELARRVGLSARQVEVWFQNRRARTKLKQTEVDCELLRRWCDRLTDENARLRRDLAEIRAAAVSVVCPSCCDKNMPMLAAGNVG